MIEISNLTKSFGENVVLDGISCNINAGEVVCLIGASGAGKSTLLRCINGLETYESGIIKVNNQVVNVNHKKSIRMIRREATMVFQRFNLFPHRTALENITEGPIHVKKTPKSEAIENGLRILKQVGLENFADRYPSQLSGGQQQRVAIARALAMDPSVILFDEPTSALDPELVGDVLEVMRDLADGGMTMVVVTHEIAFARDVADKALFLDSGKIEEKGNAKEILTNPKSDRLKLFLKRVT